MSKIQPRSNVPSRLATWLGLGLAIVTLLIPTTAIAATILDFETLLNGEDGPFSFVTVDGTVDISGSGPNLGVAAFDSSDPGPNSGAEDLDLLVNTGIVLILQDSNEPAKTGNIFDSPDDDTNGGLITMLFSVPATLFSIDLIDINGNGPATVTLFDSGGMVRSYFAPMEWTGDINVGDVGIGTLDLLLQADQAGVGPGNPLAIFSQDAGFDENDVTKLEIDFEGSAALDNLIFVPEPGTVVLFGLGLVGLGLTRRPQK